MCYKIIHTNQGSHTHACTLGMCDFSFQVTEVVCLKCAASDFTAEVVVYSPEYFKYIHNKNLPNLTNQ